jgi:hypothetical protein
MDGIDILANQLTNASALGVANLCATCWSVQGRYVGRIYTAETLRYTISRGGLSLETISGTRYALRDRA